MSTVIDCLRFLDRKERFAVLRQALGFEQTAPELGKCFRKRLSACIDISVPENAYVAMDYHLDWILMALHFAKNPPAKLGEAFPNPGFDINKDQEDTDLLVAFDTAGEVPPATHLVMIEAKAYLPWTNKQLASKTRRLRKIFGEDGTWGASVKPHFVLMTGAKSNKIQTAAWPAWTKNSDGAPFWLEYRLPRRGKVTRCNAGGKPDKYGGHLRLDPVPRSTE